MMHGVIGWILKFHSDGGDHGGDPCASEWHTEFGISVLARSAHSPAVRGESPSTAMTMSLRRASARASARAAPAARSAAAASGERARAGVSMRAPAAKSTAMGAPPRALRAARRAPTTVGTRARRAESGEV